MEWLVSNAIAALFMPLGIVLIVLLVALLMAWRWPLQAWRPIALAVVLLYALSTPFVAHALLWMLEPSPRDPAADASGQAIVVLGGGTYHQAPEYGGDTVKARTLQRLRYAARLQRALGKPVLVTGGAPDGGPTPEGQLMKQALEKDFQAPVQWVEQVSNNTLEHGRLVYRLLKPAGVERIYLVTHAWHMPRARLVFERAGFVVIPAPTAFATRHQLTILDFLPKAEALSDSTRFFHELMSITWYYVRLLFKF
jgi:uncharacterized SAM-binding protein YcdF (DUF218 family)